MVDDDSTARYGCAMDLDRIEALERRVAQLEQDRRAVAEAGVKVLQAVFQVVEYSNASFLSITSNESIAALKNLSEMIAMARAAFINIGKP
jgi:hypothetical protein